MRRLALPLIVVLVLSAIPAVALAVTKTDRTTGSVKKTGTSGTYLVYKGTAKSRLFGTGTVTQKIGAVGLRGTFTIKYKRGTLKGTVRAHAKSNGNGVDVTGTYTYTGGTGIFKKARGSGSFKSKADQALTRTTFDQTGKITY